MSIWYIILVRIFDDLRRLWENSGIILELSGDQNLQLPSTSYCTELCVSRVIIVLWLGAVTLYFRTTFKPSELGAIIHQINT